MNSQQRTLAVPINQFSLYLTPSQGLTYGMKGAVLNENIGIFSRVKLPTAQLSGSEFYDFILSCD
jgi:hypothetical protein